MAGIDTYTKLLLHCDGADASTTFTDSATSKTITAYGNAQIDTAQRKFGSGSGLFDGTGDYLTIPDSDDFTVGSNDFTIDFWVKKNGDGITEYICRQGPSDGAGANTSIGIYINSDNTAGFFVFTGSTIKQVISGGTIAGTSWVHVACIRDNNSLKIYFGGVFQTNSTDVTGVTVNNSANKFVIGANGEELGSYFNGWIDEFRFSKGIARWTSNFTPPTRAYGALLSGIAIGSPMIF